MNSVNQRVEIKIDVDGSGPLKPFPVTCEVLSDGRIMTFLHHSNEQLTPVDGFQEPGSFIQDINYDADFDQIEALLNRSISCTQRISYECKHSKLFNTPGNYILNILRLATSEIFYINLSAPFQFLQVIILDRIRGGSVGIIRRWIIGVAHCPGRENASAV